MLSRLVEEKEKGGTKAGMRREPVHAIPLEGKGEKWRSKKKKNWKREEARVR